METLISEDRYDNDTIEDLKKDFPVEFVNLEEALIIFKSENDLNILKLEIPEDWTYLNKSVAYPYGHFNSLDDYQKPVNDLKKTIVQSIEKSSFKS